MLKARWPPSPIEVISLALGSRPRCEWRSRVAKTGAGRTMRPLPNPPNFTPVWRLARSPIPATGVSLHSEGNCMVTVGDDQTMRGVEVVVRAMIGQGDQLLLIRHR